MMYKKMDIDLNQSLEYYIELLENCDEQNSDFLFDLLITELDNGYIINDLISYKRRENFKYQLKDDEIKKKFLKLPKKQKLFYKCIDKGQIKKVRKFIKNGIDVEYSQFGVLPAIFRAVKNNNLEIIKLLINEGKLRLNHVFHFTDYDFEKQVMHPLIEYVGKLMDHDGIIYLLNSGLYCNMIYSDEKRILLNDICELDYIDYELIKILINYGINVNHIYYYGMWTTALYESVNWDQKILTNILLRAGANPLFENSVDEIMILDLKVDTALKSLMHQKIEEFGHRYISCDEYYNEYKKYNQLDSLLMLAYKVNKFVDIPDCIVKDHIRERLKYDYMLKLIRKRQNRKQFVNKNMCKIAYFYSKQNPWFSDHEAEFNEFVEEESDNNPWNIEAGKFMFLCIKFNYLIPISILYNRHSFLWTMDLWFIEEACKIRNRLSIVKYLVEESDPDQDIIEDIIETSIEYHNDVVIKYLLKLKHSKNNME